MAGHPVPDDFRQRLLDYVRHILDKGGENPDLLELQSYGCYVLAMSGKPQRPIMNRLMELADSPDSSKLPIAAPERNQAKLFLSLAWLSAGRRDLAMSLVPRTPPLPRSNRQLAGNVGSPIRNRALLVSTMLTVEPDHPSLPGLLQQLADAGRKHEWRSTQDVAFAVLAIGRYLRSAKTTEPYQSLELLLAGRKLASAGNGASLSFSLSDKSDQITLEKAADRLFDIRVGGAETAKAYVSWLQSGVPLVAPGDQDNGIKIRRRYMPYSATALTSTPTTAPSRPLLSARSGNLILVAISLEAPAANENIVIEDMLPAGLEIENPRLATSAAAEDGAVVVKKDDGFDTARVDMHDDRLVLIGRMPNSGRMQYTYLTRTVTPGTYVVPPIRAEYMYDIGVNSISGAGGTFTVLPMERKAVAKK